MKKLFTLALCVVAQFISAQNLVITNVNVIPIEGGETILKNQMVIIKEGKITDITPFKKEQTKQTPVIDGTGKYLIPGLADMHVHFPDEKEMPLQQFFKLNLAAGVTTLRSMRGEPRHLTLRDSINKKLILAPDLYISISLPSDSTVTASDLKNFVIKSKAEGWDFIKYLSGLTPALFDSAALYCKQNNIKLAGHVFNQDLQIAIKNNQASVEHYQSILKEYRKDSLQFNNVLQQLKDKNMFVCPTLSFYYIWGMQFNEDELKARNGMNNINAETAGKWQKEYNDYSSKYKTPEKIAEREKMVARVKQNLSDFGKLLKQMNDAKVKLLLSPDESAFNAPGFAMLEEMKLYKKTGLSNYDILKIATYNAACFFDKQNEWGSITKNKKANLVLLDKNPLEDIENVKAVNTIILNGQVLKPELLLKN
jgi:dihydroorotase-like cyclic amidohydrolase